MRATEGYEIAAKILRTSGHDRNPEEIAKALGIEVYDKYDLGKCELVKTKSDSYA